MLELPVVDKGNTKLQMVAIGNSIKNVTFKSLAHFIIIASERVELDLFGLDIHNAIGPKSLKEEFSTKTPDYQRNIGLLFELATANCVQFFS